MLSITKSVCISLSRPSSIEELVRNVITDSVEVAAVVGVGQTPAVSEVPTESSVGFSQSSASVH